MTRNTKPATRNPRNVGNILEQAAKMLHATSPTPRLDAEVLLMHLCGLDRSSLITRHEMALTGEQQNRLADLVARRRRG